jgi:hypothetical protein
MPMAKRTVKILRRSPVPPAKSPPAGSNIHVNAWRSSPEAPSAKRRCFVKVQKRGLGGGTQETCGTRICQVSKPKDLLDKHQEQPAKVKSEDGDETVAIAHAAVQASCGPSTARMSRFPVRATRSSHLTKESSLDDQDWLEEDRPGQDHGAEGGRSKRGSADSQGGSGSYGDGVRYRGVTRKYVAPTPCI